MGFTTPCFIRKNTPTLQERLKNLGYLSLDNDNDKRDGLVADRNGFMYSIFEKNVLGSTYNCGINEELFLAIAALRDDTNNSQWFIAESSLSVSFHDAIGNDHYFVEPKGSFFFWDIEWQNATIVSGFVRKATVDELIEHFKQ